MLPHATLERCLIILSHEAHTSLHAMKSETKISGLGETICSSTGDCESQNHPTHAWTIIRVTVRSWIPAPLHGKFSWVISVVKMLSSKYVVINCDVSSAARVL